MKRLSFSQKLSMQTLCVILLFSYCGLTFACESSYKMGSSEKISFPLKTHTYPSRKQYKILEDSLRNMRISEADIPSIKFSLKDCKCNDFFCEKTPKTHGFYIDHTSHQYTLFHCTQRNALETTYFYFGKYENKIKIFSSDMAFEKLEILVNCLTLEFERMYPF